MLGDRDRGFECLERAGALVQDRPTSVRKAHVVSNVSRFHMLAGDAEAAIRLGREALSMLDEMGGDEEGRAFVLNNIGAARVRAGDVGGVEDLEESVAISEAINSAESVRGYGNLASTVTDLGELERRAEALERGVAAAKRFGLGEHLGWLNAMLLWQPFWDGRWDEASHALDGVIDEFEASGYWMETPCRWLRARIELGRGDERRAVEDAERGIERARLAKDPQMLWPALSLGARVYASTDPLRAGQMVNEVLADWQAREYFLPVASEWLQNIAIALDVLGRTGELADAASSASAIPWLEAAVAYSTGDFAGASDMYNKLGAFSEEAYARLAAARAHVEAGRRAEADVQLERALAFFRRAGATADVREGEALMAASA
jgi:tetratricopeptide (TPR) repeat protein